jgi:hypothetical protein
MLKVFKPAFLGRVTLVPYLPLSDAVIRQIVELQLGRIRRRVYDSYRAGFEYEPALIETIAARCTETASGARNIEKILSQTLLPELAEVLARLARAAISRVGLNVPQSSLAIRLDSPSERDSRPPRRSTATSGARSLPRLQRLDRAQSLQWERAVISVRQRGPDNARDSGLIQ